MRSSMFKPVAAAILVLSAASLLAACSSSFGGGSAKPAPNAVILQPGQRVVCADGTTPPCRM